MLQNIYIRQWIKRFPRRRAGRLFFPACLNRWKWCIILVKWAIKRSKYPQGSHLIPLLYSGCGVKCAHLSHSEVCICLFWIKHKYFILSVLTPIPRHIPAVVSWLKVPNVIYIWTLTCKISGLSLFLNKNLVNKASDHTPLMSPPLMRTFPRLSSSPSFPPSLFLSLSLRCDLFVNKRPPLIKQH